MGIRLFLKNQPAQTIQNYDAMRPIEKVAQELVAKAKADVQKMQPVAKAVAEKIVEVVAPVVVKAAEKAVEAAVESVTTALVEGDTPQVVAVEAVEAAVEAAVESVAGPTAKSAVEVVLEKIQAATGVGKPNKAPVK